MPFSIKDIKAAQKRIKGHALATPLLTNSYLDEKCGGTFLLKAENLQLTGSFKIRGAFNRLSMIPAKDRKKGVAAYSAGNHAQGVALSAKLLKIPATIFMPNDAPKMKIENTKKFGATVKFFKRGTGQRERMVKDFVEKTGATFISPFDDHGIIAGQRTIGLEVAHQAKELGVKTIDQVIIPCSGGGLSAGIGTALKALYPKIQIYVVEPEGYHSTKVALEKGAIQPKLAIRPPSICDALLKEAVGKLTFAQNHKNKAKGVIVPDKDVKAAMRFAFQRMKLVLEPGGAIALAAVLSGRIKTKNKTTAIILSGGNVDEKLFAEILN